MGPEWLGVCLLLLVSAKRINRKASFPSVFVFITLAKCLEDSRVSGLTPGRTGKEGLGRELLQAAVLEASE